MAKFYITTPIYYVNDKPHIGHAYTTIVADILARYHRLKGDQTYFLTGTDEHGSKVAQSAEKINYHPQKFCDERSAMYQLAFDTLNISNDDFIRTTEKRHEERVMVILEKMKKGKTPKGNDVFFEGEYSGLYCTGCEAYKKEEDLIDGKCPDHLREPEQITEKNWFFRLSDYNDVLMEKIFNGELKIAPEIRKNEMAGLLKQGLEDVAISRNNVAWGIPLPWDKEQTVYVWIEALMNYITALGYGTKNQKLFKKFWPAVHLMAKDIIKFHALIWPAILITLGEQIPELVFAHGFFTINGQKMSKTIGNVIDPIQLVNDIGVDPARFYLATEMTFGNDGDVSIERMKEAYGAHLANGLGNLFARITGMYSKYAENIDYKVKINTKKYSLIVDETWKNYENFLDNLVVDNAVGEVWKLIGWCDKFVEENKPWELAKQKDYKKLSEVILILLENLRHIGWMISPIMPDTSVNILTLLGYFDTDKTLKYAKLKKWGIQAKTSPQNAILFPRLA